MSIPSKSVQNPRKFDRMEVIAIIWILIAMSTLFPVQKILDGSFPIFTVPWLIVPLINLLKNRDSSKIGFRVLPLMDLLKYSLINLSGSLVLTMIFEPWSHTYKTLFSTAIAGPNTDTTFGWLARFPGFSGWVCFLLFAGLVTLFAEELFFRGWLLQWLHNRMGFWMTILVQASLFTLPQILAAFLLPPLQGILYAVVYSWLAIGLVGGWTASKTQSIWPSLISATIYNLILVIVSIS